MTDTTEDREPRPRPRPTLRGWLVIAATAVLVVVAVGTRRQDVFFLGALLGLVVIGSLLSLRWSRPRLEARRTIRPDAVDAGDDAEVSITVTGRDARLVEQHWLDGAPDGLVVHRHPGIDVVAGGPAHPGSLSDAAPSARSESKGGRVLRYAIRGARRGRYELGPLRIRRRDPLGLARADAVVGGTGSLLVTPRVTPLDDSPLDEAAAGGTELVIMRRTAPSPDEVAVRDYERGDPIRRINWRASAKRDRLMVRQEEQRSNPQSWLLLDTVAPPYAKASDPFELGIELVASLGAHAIERGFLVGVVETGVPQLQGEAAPGGAAFSPPEGARLLATELASIGGALRGADPIGSFADAMRRGGAGTAAFAVLVGGPGEWWAELAGLRGLAEPCVAFLLTPKAADAHAELSAAGWTCVVAEEGMGVEAMWAAAAAASGRRMGVRRD
ncbi:MAG: DUF58 domain-containing protein [Microbacteriaceae bacterium]|nr:DUF58 domain-containing protein [Microbacteriaceae bacterium]